MIRERASGLASCGQICGETNGRGLLSKACLSLSWCHLVSGDTVVTPFLVWKVGGKETPSQGDFMFSFQLNERKDSEFFLCLFCLF